VYPLEKRKMAAKLKNIIAGSSLEKIQEYSKEQKGY